jgi:hypothetical protein
MNNNEKWWGLENEIENVNPQIKHWIPVLGLPSLAKDVQQAQKNREKLGYPRDTNRDLLYGGVNITYHVVLMLYLASNLP